jgi:hypothetical protein
MCSFAGFFFASGENATEIIEQTPYFCTNGKLWYNIMLPLDSKNRARVRLYIKVGKKNHIPNKNNLFVLFNIMQVKLNIFPPFANIIKDGKYHRK